MKIVAMKTTDNPKANLFQPETGYLGFLLRQAAHAYRLKMEKVLNEFSITPPQFTILKIVSIYNGTTNAEIARLAVLTPQTINLMVNKLEKHAFIHKKAHPINKKIQCIEITAQGLDLLDLCQKKIDQLEQTLEDEFSEEDILLVRKWLGNISQS